MFLTAKNRSQSSSRVFWDERCSWAIMQKGYLYKLPRNRELNPYLGCPKTFHVPNRQKPIAMLKSGGLRWTFSSAIMQKDTFTSPQETGSWTHISAAPKLFMFPSAKNPLQSSSRVFWDERSREQSCKRVPLQAPKKQGVEPISWQSQDFWYFWAPKSHRKAQVGWFEMNLLVSNRAKRYLYKPSSNGDLNSYLGSPKTFHVLYRQKTIAKLKSGGLRWTFDREQSCKKIPLQAPKKRGVEPISRWPQNFSCSQAPKTDRKAQVGCFEMNLLVSNHAKRYLYKPPRNGELNPYLGSPKTFHVPKRWENRSQSSSRVFWDERCSWAIVQKGIPLQAPNKQGS